MMCTGIVFFIILLIIEYRIFEGVIYAVRGCFERSLPSMSEDGQIDDDVLDEKRKVNLMPMNEIQSHSLILQSLSKFYGKFLAVNQISIGIKRYKAVNFNTN